MKTNLPAVISATETVAKEAKFEAVKRVPLNIKEPLSGSTVIRIETREFPSTSLKLKSLAVNVTALLGVAIVNTSSTLLLLVGASLTGLTLILSVLWEPVLVM